MGNLFDQEVVVSRTSGADTVAGTTYRIVSQNTLDFTTIGAPNNSIGTVFIATLVDTLGIGDALSEITSPNKGIPSTDPWPALTGTELNTEEDACAPPGTNEANDVSGWINLGYGTFESEADPYLGSYSAHFVANGNGQRSDTIIRTVLPNTLYRVSFWYKLAVSTSQTYAYYRWGNSAISDLFVPNTNLRGNAEEWTEVVDYIWTGSETTLELGIGEGGINNDVDINIDYLTIRPIQISWVPEGTNKIEIDEINDNLLITYKDNANGATLLLADAADLSSDLRVGQDYLLTLYASVNSGDTVTVQVLGQDGITVLADSGNIAETRTKYNLPFTASHATGDKIQFTGMAAGEIVNIDTLSLVSLGAGGSGGGFQMGMSTRLK